LSEEEVLGSLREFSRLRRGRSFTAAEYSAWEGRAGTAMGITRRWGSWRKMLAAAGISRAVGGWYDAAELMEILERVWKQVKQRPSREHMLEFGPVTDSPYKTRWGSLAEACRQLARYHAGEISREELLRGRPREFVKRKRRKLGNRWLILARDGHCCRGCGARAGEPGVKLEVDHIVPQSRGGSDEPSNLRTLCRACNVGRGDGRREAA
jgi:5-methylcytosine-specific restriction endonuclease McrA